MMKPVHLAMALGLATCGVAGQAQPLVADCTPIGPTFHMCDDHTDWQQIYQGDGLVIIERSSDGNITAQVEVAQHPRVGIDVRKRNYGSPLPDMPEGVEVTEALTTVDGFAAITYIFNAENDGQTTVHAQTLLLLNELRLTAKSAQIAKIYTPEHAAFHADMLHGLTHEWSLQ